tara:strand:- start:1601 stop:2059 length:459 start_codon:yes stop_codon:yes gene_type:complete
MKTLLIAAMVAIITFAPAIATADDEDDVIAAMQDYISGWNTGDAAKVAEHLTSDATAFAQGTGLAMGAFNQANLQNGMDNGGIWNLSFRDMKVQVYGDTAIFTAYEVGNIRFPNGNGSQGPWRYTAVLVKQGGVWKQAHRHTSPLRTGAPGQ